MEKESEIRILAGSVEIFPGKVDESARTFHLKQ